VHRFQKAIKKVRAVQRMRRNRGFAFSQTEDGGKQDQVRSRIPFSILGGSICRIPALILTNLLCAGAADSCV
jgi:hypothetical protein